MKQLPSMIAAALLMAITNQPAYADDAVQSNNNSEKCYGVSRAGKNDCASKDGANGCATLATKDGDPNSWIYVPKGLCDKLVGGKVQ